MNTTEPQPTASSLETPAPALPDQLLTAAWEKRTGYARALLGIYAATSLALGAVFGPYVIAVAVGILSAVLIAGWPNLLDLPTRLIPRIMLLLLAIALTVTALFGTVAHTTIVGAGSIITAFIAEMLRSDGRPRLIEQLSGGFTGAVVLLSGSLWIHALRSADGKNVAIVAAITLAIVSLMHAYNSVAARIAGFINGLAFALGFAYLTRIPLESALLIGVSVGAIYLLTARMSMDLPRPSPVINIATRAMIPPLAVGVIVFIAS